MVPIQFWKSALAGGNSGDCVDFAVATERPSRRESLCDGSCVAALGR
jgi:hypothetical protein